MKEGARPLRTAPSFPLRTGGVPKGNPPTLTGSPPRSSAKYPINRLTFPLTVNHTPGRIPPLENSF